MAIAGVYSPVVNQSWVTWDDDLHVTANPHLNPPTWKGFNAFWSGSYENLYIPVSYSFFFVETLLTDWLRPGFEGAARDPRLFKTGNLLLHGLCCLLVFGLLRSWTGALGGSLAGTLFFAWHPLQVESVAWISETRGLLCAFWSLLALGAYCRFARLDSAPISLTTPDTSKHQQRKHQWYGSATVFLILGLLSKPSAVSVVAMAVVVDFLHYRRDVRKISISISPWILLALADWVITKSLQADEALKNVISVPLRPIIAADAFLFYLVKVLFPSGLTIDYGRTPAVCLGSPSGYAGALILLIVLISIGMAAFRLRRNLPRVGVIAVLLFVAGLLPVLGLIPFAFQEISTVADRYAYQAMLGPALLIAWMWDLKRRFCLRIVIGMIIVSLAFAARQQTSIWRDNQTLYAHALSQNPRSWTALNNQGAILEHEGQTEAAIQKFRESLNLYPSNGKAAYNLGICLKKLGNLDEARKSFELAIAAAPFESQFQEALADYHSSQGSINLAVTHFQAALKSDPRNVRLLNQLGNMLVQQERPIEARDTYELAIRNDPDFWPVRFNLGKLLLQEGQVQLAESHLLKALKLQPDQPEILYYLALTAGRNNQFDAAIERLQSAFKITEDKKLRHAIQRELAVVYNAKGIESRAQEEFAAAVKLFENAVEFDPGFAAGHFNLAQTLMSQGNLKAARKHLNQATSLVPRNSPAAVDIAKELQKLKQLDQPSDEQ